MKSEWDKLRDKYDSDVQKLQNTCPHKKTRVIEFFWAPGHSSGKGVMCLRCHKRLKCQKCKHDRHFGICNYVDYVGMNNLRCLCEG